MFYFAYGSNMNPERMKNRGANFFAATKAKLKDYQLKFNKISTKREGEGFANIVAAEGCVVEGVVYEMDDSSLFKLDEYENYPLSYRRDIVELVISESNLLEATTYIANSDHISENLLPSSSYLNHLLSAKDFLSTDYYDFLINHPTL